MNATWLAGRMIAKLVANVGGYFWLPCPCCGEFFGGHEIRSVDGHRDSIPTREAGIASCICRSCTAVGKGCAAHARTTGYLVHDCEAARSALAEVDR